MNDTTDLSTVVHEAIAALEAEGNVRAVFGEPVKLETRTVIPVATVALGGGGGGVRTLGSAIDIVRRWTSRKDTARAPAPVLAGGAGGGLEVRPAGFIWEEAGKVVFTRIEGGRHSSS